MQPLFQLEEYLLAYEHRAEISLCSSGLEALPLLALMHLASESDQQRWQSLKLGYSTPQGLPELRDTISQQYQSVAPDGVMVFAGACEAIYITLQALLTSDDHSVVITPCYQSLKSVPASAGSVTEVPLRFEDRWQLDLERVRSALRPNTRMIVINFPNNPTGAIPDRQTLEALVEIARLQGAWIFSDEVYRLMELNPADRLPPIADLYEKGLSVGSMSKAYGMPGIRIGWLATPDHTIIPKLLSLRHYTTIAPNTPGEWLTVMALRSQPQILERQLTDLRNNFERFRQFMRDHADQLDWVEPKGGCLAFPKLRQNLSAEAFSLDLLQSEKILVLPGELYDQPHGFLRLGFGSSTLPKALSGLDRQLGRSQKNSKHNP